MFFQRIYDKSLAQASYLIGCQSKSEAIVIDAKRDIDTYLEIATENNLTITHITETHIHADFLSGSRELAEVTGAKMYLSDEGGEDWQYEFSHIGLKNGDLINVGNLTLKVIHTPGHTVGGCCYYLPEEEALFCGDTLFCGSIGRTDLPTGSSRDLAHSIREKLMILPDETKLYPGHMDESTIGYEKEINPFI